MKEHPILFSAPMINALRDRKKTQTRRLVNPLMHLIVDGDETTGRVVEQSDRAFGDLATEYAASPYGEAGDQLWVRETWAPWSEDIEERGEAEVIADAKRQMPWAAIVYRADANGGDVNVKRWRPSIFLPRWASRMSLAVTSVHVERLQDITSEDIVSEGAVAWEHHDPNLGKSFVSSFDRKAYSDLRSLWARGWDSINGKRAPWFANPWVWVVNFKIAGGAS
jgi:hypothetical protein